MRLAQSISLRSSLVAVLSLSGFIAGCSDDNGTTPTPGVDAGPVGSVDSGAGKDAANDTAAPIDAGGTDDAADAADAAPAVAPPAVYTLSNGKDDNAVHVYTRDANGMLTFARSVSTGGKGTGAGLGDQGALVFDKATNRFYAVNAGDNTLSLLTLGADGTLTAHGTVASGGIKPISVSFVGDVVYAANFGDDTHPANVSGFRVENGALKAIDNSTMPLSADAAQPAQLQFTPDGKALIVTEKATSKIDSFPFASGLLTKAAVKDSAGPTPFGFDFGPGPSLIVSEAFMAGKGATSSYAIGAGGALTTISPSVESQQVAPCWVAVSGTHAYVTNTKSNSVTGYSIAANGAITLDDASGVAGATGATPIDEQATPAGDFLYVLNATGDATHSISIFKIATDGKLTKVTDFDGQATRAAGLVVR
jgi:6-phosphogluconolactonase (cycloisomerase 2 family)